MDDLKPSLVSNTFSHSGSAVYLKIAQECSAVLRGPGARGHQPWLLEATPRSSRGGSPASSPSPDITRPPESRPFPAPPDSSPAGRTGRRQSAWQVWGRPATRRQGPARSSRACRRFLPGARLLAGGEPAGGASVHLASGICTCTGAGREGSAWVQGGGALLAPMGGRSPDLH